MISIRTEAVTQSCPENSCWIVIKSKFSSNSQEITHECCPILTKELGFLVATSLKGNSTEVTFQELLQNI